MIFGSDGMEIFSQQMTEISLSLELWFGLHKSKHEGMLRLFCFPFAGTGASMFRNWSRYLPREVELWPVQLPGRENRIAEPPLTRLSELVPLLADLLMPVLTKPFLFFGHSMGALISFELGRELRRRKTAQPAALFLSGKYAPQLVREELRYSLPDDDFLAELQLLNQNRSSDDEEQELLRLMLPTIRADFSVCDTYRYTEEPPLNCPFAVWGGLEDPEASPSDIEGWREQTTGPVSVRMFEGDHFFLLESERLFLESLVAELDRLFLSAHSQNTVSSGLSGEGLAA
jgi:medium-chain acyl-[acyl-carrier-protein] hydrolase